MKKPKVLYVSEGLYNGGTEKVMLNYLYNIDRSKVDIEILYCSADDTFHLPMLLRDNYVVKALGGDYRILRNYCRELNKFFKNNKYDVVHIHTISIRNLVVAYYAKLHGCKAVIFHSHINSLKCGWKHKVIRKFMSIIVNYKVACSRVAGEYMFGKKFNVFNNAIALDDYLYSSSNRTEIRTALNISDDTIVLGNVGRLVDQKNHKYLLDIISAMKARSIKCTALVVGGGIREQELRNKAISLDISDSVILTLNQPDASRYYSAFDVLVFPSLYEGLSLALVEAQANGLPIVYAENLTDEAKVLDNVEMLPIGNDDIDKWVDAILRLKGYRIADTVPPLAARGFELKSLANKIEQLYIDIANSKKLPKINI